MKMEDREELDAYYREAKSWGEDRSEGLQRSRRIAWIVAAAAAVLALVEALALWQLIPLKTVEPYTLMVDKNTGYVQALKPLEAGQIAPSTALTQSFVVQYVIARESFDIATIRNDYRKVALWSEGRVRSAYVGRAQAGSPQSMLARLPRDAVVEAKVKSVSPLSANTLLVRFDTQRRDPNGQQYPVQSWASVVGYRYSGEPMQLDERMINPLGFKVTRYRRTPESAPLPDLPATDASDTP